jgi:hypothetical protein
MPVLPPDTLVWGVQWFNRLKVGQVVIFVHDGKERIKRIDTIKGDELFLVGDNKSAGKDSRHFGWISLGQVKARVIWPHSPKDRAEAV